MNDRELNLIDPFASVPSMAREALLPDWAHKEAAAEEDWEVVEKRRLEISAFARDFKRAFPDEAFSTASGKGKDAGYRIWNGKTKEISQGPEAAVSAAADWLSDKCKGDVAKAKLILNSTGLVDEFKTQIMEVLGAEIDAEDIELGEANVRKHNKLEDSPAQPGSALDEYDSKDQTTVEQVLDDSQESMMRKGGMERNAVISPYGIVMTAEYVQVWKKGELLKAFSPDDMGGFPVIAEEMESMRSAEDVEALFDLPADAPYAEPKVSQSALSIGQAVAFKAGGKVHTGIVTFARGDSATVQMGKTATEVPQSRLVSIKRCCADYVGNAKFNVCPECATSIGALR